MSVSLFPYNPPYQWPCHQESHQSVLEYQINDPGAGLLFRTRLTSRISWILLVDPLISSVWLDYNSAGSSSSHTAHWGGDDEGEGLYGSQMFVLVYFSSIFTPVVEMMRNGWAEGDDGGRLLHGSFIHVTRVSFTMSSLLLMKQLCSKVGPPAVSPVTVFVTCADCRLTLFKFNLIHQDGTRMN